MPPKDKTPDSSKLDVKVVFKDRLPWINELMLEELLISVARSTWEAQGGEAGRSLTLFVDDRDHGEAHVASGTSRSSSREVRLHCRTLCKRVPSGEWVREIISTLTHEVAHQWDADRKEKMGEGHSTAPRDRLGYLADESEILARAEETASDMSLYPGMGLLPRPDWSGRDTVSPKDAERYRVAHQKEGVREKAERVASTVRAEMKNMVGPQPIENPAGDRMLETLAPFYAEIARMGASESVSDLTCREQIVLSRFLQFQHKMNVASYIAGQHRPQEEGVIPPHSVDPREWKMYVEEKNSIEIQMLAPLVAGLVNLSPQNKKIKRREIFDFLRARVDEDREREPSWSNSIDESVQYYRQVVEGKRIEPVQKEATRDNSSVRGLHASGQSQGLWKGRVKEEVKSLNFYAQKGYRQLNQVLVQQVRSFQGPMIGSSLVKAVVAPKSRSR